VVIGTTVAEQGENEDKNVASASLLLEALSQISQRIEVSSRLLRLGIELHHGQSLLLHCSSRGLRCSG
jgi:hypothetical protein